jgi:cytochrome oxidase Cu insertion factor (SCO1/SenC/PrrC family)
VHEPPGDGSGSPEYHTARNDPFSCFEDDLMRTTRRWLLLGTLALAGVVSPSAADQPPEAKTGLKVGVRAPAFALKDQSGTERSLDEFLKKGKVALVFYRSADW